MASTGTHTRPKSGNAVLSGWHPADVKAGIQKKGETLSGLALRHGFNEAYLRNALVRPLFRGEQIIASFLGVPPREIWPDRYDARGEPTYRAWSASRRNPKFRTRRA